MDEPKLVESPFPMRGIDLQPTFEAQRAGTCCEGLNVGTFDTFTERGRGGSRPGLKRFIDQALPLDYDDTGTRLIQDLNLVVIGDTSALILPGDPPYPYIDDPSDAGPPSSWGGGPIYYDWDRVAVDGTSGGGGRMPGVRKVRKKGSGVRPKKNLLVPAPGTGGPGRLFQGQMQVNVTVHSVPIDFFGQNILFTACVCVPTWYLSLVGAPTLASQMNGWWCQKKHFFEFHGITQTGYTLVLGSNLITGNTSGDVSTWGVRQCQVPADYPGDATHNVLDNITSLGFDLSCTAIDVAGLTNAGQNQSAYSCFQEGFPL